MHPHTDDDETEIVALQKRMDNLREQKHLQEEEAGGGGKMKAGGGGQGPPGGDGAS